MKDLIAIAVLFSVSLIVGARKPAMDQQITSVVMEQFECFWGTCPHYRVSIDENGSATYLGLAAVKTEGSVQLQFSTAAFDRIAREIAHIRYFDLRSRYASKADGCKELLSDHSAVRFLVTRGDTQKEVFLYYGCKGPRVISSLARLTALIDEATGVEQLVGRE